MCVRVCMHVCMDVNRVLNEICAQLGMLRCKIYVVPPWSSLRCPFLWRLLSPSLPSVVCFGVFRVFLDPSFRPFFFPPFLFSFCGPLHFLPLPLAVSLLRVAMAGFRGSGLAFVSPVVSHCVFGIPRRMTLWS